MPVLLVLGFAAFIFSVLLLGDNTCGKAGIREVRGDSMFPSLSPGEEVLVSLGYYNCSQIKRGDLVLFNYSEKEIPLVKKVRAVPGDRWEISSVGSGNNIFVNGKVLKNSAGIAYELADSRLKMVELYIRDYPILPGNAYLLLGDSPAGSVDSTVFGLADKKDILGRVYKNNVLSRLIFRKNVARAASGGYVYANPADFTCTIRSASGTSVAASVSCSGSERIISGGCNVSGYYIYGNYPSGQGWACTTTGGWPSAVAQCCY